MTMPYWAERLRVRMIHELGGYTDEDVAKEIAECKGIRETFFPEDIIQCDLPGPPPMDYDLQYALVTLTEVDKKIMAALGRKF